MSGGQYHVAAVFDGTQKRIYLDGVLDASTAYTSALVVNTFPVVIGGNALSGGVGGVAGPVMGAITLGIIQNIISFASIDNWWETLVKATIIVLALAAPGIVNLFRNRRGSS